MEKRAMRNMTDESPMKLILGFLIPMLSGLLFWRFHNMMDTIIMGKYLGVSTLASVGFTGSINFMIIGFCISMCGGFVIPVTRKLGKENGSAMRKFVANSGWLAAAFAAVMTVVVCIFCRQVLVQMRTPGDIIGGAYSYIFVIFMGVPAVYLYSLLSGIIRSLGDSITLIILLLISSAMNIILDLFTIIVLKIDVVEAAWATVISRAVSSILCLLCMRKRFTILKIQEEGWKPDVYVMRALCGMGIPMGLQYSITAIDSVILQTAMNSLGSVVVASVAVGSKVSMLFCCPFDAMGVTMVTYGGQGTGAKKLDRVRQGVKSCIALGATYSVLALMVLYLFSDVVVLLFVDTGESGILRNTGQFLMINVAFYFPLTLVSIVRFMIQGLGYSKSAIIAGACEMGARCAVAFLVSWFGYNAVCFANPLAWITTDIFLIPAYLYVMKRFRRRFGQVEIHPVVSASAVTTETGCK